MGHKTQNSYMLISQFKVIQERIILSQKKKKIQPITPSFIKADNFRLIDTKFVSYIIYKVSYSKITYLDGHSIL